MKTNTFKKGVVGLVTMTMLFFVAVPPVTAKAATLTELQAQIESLLQQIQTLQKLLNELKAKESTCTAPRFDLSYGDRGPEVTKLQRFLISHGYNIPAGATGYFGNQTRLALQAFQAANGISPALGYHYGPATRAVMQKQCTTETKPPTSVPQLSGEAVLTDFSAKNGDNTDLEEGQTKAKIMEIDFTVEDGDAILKRVDLAFRPDRANNENNPWDVFSTLSIWRNGKKLKTVNAGDENKWRRDYPAEGEYTIRISGLKELLKEGEKVKFTVTADVFPSVKGTSDGEIWNIFVPDNGIRALDADHAAVYAGNAEDYVTLNLDRAGAYDELLVRRSDADPSGGVLPLKANRHSGYLPVFAFDLDTNDSRNGIEIYRLPVRFTVGTGTMETLVRDVRLVVKDKTYTDNTTVDGNTGVVTFKFDPGEFTLTPNERTTVVVEADFKPLRPDYEGTTLVSEIRADDIEAAGKDDLNTTKLQGSARSETHFLVTHGIEVTDVSADSKVTVVSGDNNDYATFSLALNVTAFEQDVYIKTGTAGVTYELQDSFGNTLSASGTPVVTMDAKERGGYFFIPEGDTKRLTLTVTYTPGVPNTVSRLQLKSINFSDTTSAPNQHWLAVPESHYRTPPAIIVN